MEALEGKGRTELEKATYTARQVLNRIKELGGDPNTVLPQKETLQPEFVTKEDFAENYARTLARSEDELKVVMWHYRFGIQRTGNIHEDIENAHLLANKGKLKKVYSEMQRAQDAKPPIGGGSGQKVPAKSIPEMPKDQVQILKKRGFSLNPKNGRWEAKFTAYRFDRTTDSWISEKK